MTFILRTGATPPGVNGELFHEGWRQEDVSTVTDINPVIERLTQAMTDAGYASREAFSVRLALEEAIVNAIKHGHQGDCSKEVRVGYLVEPEQVLLVIEDEGPGFTPDDLPDPLAPENLERACGRGVFLIRHYMTWVRYNDSGNCVTMCKQRS
ncbi:MAG: ATP-binding protein [Gemmataceae bacterium]|nr:ATP-binding protein [Gemmataceae bacterium]